MSNKKKLIDDAINDPAVRKELASQDHLWFFRIYLSHHITYGMADFQHTMFSLTQDESVSPVVITAFRGSGKSTIMTLSYPLWAILGKQKKKHIVILSQTTPQARLHLKNIKEELESNELLREDLGPFREDEAEWNARSLIIEDYDARITAMSIDSSIRGLKHGANRPDLIILDDVQDRESVQTQQSRDKTWRKFVSDVVPMGDLGTRMVVVGNILHRDSLIMRLKDGIEDGEMNGVYHSFPLLDEKGSCMWPEKFPDRQSIEELRATVDEMAWQHEYLLDVSYRENEVIQEDWIRYYDTLPDEESQYTAIGVDPAISEKESADCTAMVPARVFGYGEDMEVYILPDIVNDRLTHLDTIKTAKQLSKSMGIDRNAKLFVEDVAYQKALIETLEKEHRGVVEGIKVGRQDKWARLKNVSHVLQNGRVFFPEGRSAEGLINQLVGLQTERHDDLADAFSLVLGEIIRKNKPRSGFPDIDYDDTEAITAGLMDKEY